MEPDGTRYTLAMKPWTSERITSADRMLIRREAQRGSFLRARRITQARYHHRLAGPFEAREG